MRLVLPVCCKELLISLLLAVLSLSGCRTPEEQRQRHLAKGKQFLQDRDYGRAIIEFKNAAGSGAADPEVYYQLGMAYMGTKDFRSAVAAFRKTLELDPKHVQAQLRIAQMRALTNNPSMLQDADSQLKALMKSGSPTPEMLRTLAFTEFKLHDVDSAMQDLERVLSRSPGELSSSVMLAYAMVKSHDIKGAEEVLQKACQNAPSSAEARRVLGEFYRDQKRLPEADAQLQRALELDPKSGASILDLANVQLAEGRKQAAEDNFKRLTAFDGYKPLYAIFLFQQDRRDAAIHEFERLAKQNPEDREARTNLVAAYHITGRMADVDRVLNAALNKNPKDADALLQRGEILVETGKYAQAEIDLNQVKTLRPSAPEVHYVLAKLNQARGSQLAYRQELTEALQFSPHLERVRVELAQLLMEQNDAHAALNVLDAAPESQRSSTPLVVERNWVLWKLGDTAEMRQGIDKGLSQERSADLLIQDGLWKLRAGNPAGARTSLEEALKLNPADLQALAGLSQTYVAQKNAPMGLQAIKEYAARHPKSAPVQDFLATMLMAKGDRAGARAALAAAKAADPHDVQADLSLAQVDAGENKWDDARNRLEALLNTNGKNSTARLWLGNIQELKGDNNAAMQQFQKVLEANPDNAQAANNLAYLLAEYAKQPDEALKYAQKAVELVPGRPAYCDTLGWIFYRKGLYTSAVKYLEQASADPANATWKYHLAMAYAKAGQLSRGRTTLDAALKLDPRLPEAKEARQVLGSN